MKFMFSEVLKCFKARAKEGKVNVMISYPNKGSLVITFHCHNDQNHFMTLGLLMPGWQHWAAVEVSGQGIVKVPMVGNKDYADFISFLIAQKKLVSKAFDESLTGLCAEGEKRDACSVCKNYDQKIFNYVKTNMHKHWFKTKGEN